MPSALALRNKRGERHEHEHAQVEQRVAERQPEAGQNAARRQFHGASSGCERKRVHLGW